jgi:hypothetical protein
MKRRNEDTEDKKLSLLIKLTGSSWANSLKSEVTGKLHVAAERCLAYFLSACKSVNILAF